MMTSSRSPRANYTAMTRAQEQVVFVGDRAVFEAAIVAPPHASRRDVGLGSHLLG
jgi:exodeoxyribonuclease V alpha subunit